MIRQIDAAAAQSAQMLRPMNRRQFNATPRSLTDDRIDDVDACFCTRCVEYRSVEQEQLRQERMDRMHLEVNQVWGTIVMLLLEWQSCIFHLHDRQLFRLDHSNLFLHHHSLTQWRQIVNEALRTLSDEEF